MNGDRLARFAGASEAHETLAVLMKEDETMARKTHSGDENAEAQSGLSDANLETGEPIRVMLADDPVLVREGTRRLLEAEPDIQVVAEAGDGISAVEQAIASQPLCLGGYAFTWRTVQRAAEKIVVKSGKQGSTWALK